MKKLIALLFSTLSILGLWTCTTRQNDNSLFEKFQNPPADARPMVRWWWNGNCVEADEIKRELSVMKEAGIGGVEINSIAMPSHAKLTGAKPLQWAGKEWISMVKVASEEARRLGMITDLIVGSGWPFGGRFLKEDETMQRLGVKRQTVMANTPIDIDLSKYLSFKSYHSPGTENAKETSDVELISVKLIPTKLNSVDDIIDITSSVKDNRLKHVTGNEEYELVFLYNERNFQSVVHGSPGADGPIMDHYKTDVVRAYLNRIKAIEKETGIPLAELIRALFCDSIELDGSNWTDDMKEQFQARNGYDITPYLPVVIQLSDEPKSLEMSAEMAETVKRVMYDFYNTIIGVFLERFTMEFQDFCTENNVLCRYQAYGYPLYMGIFQGYMIPDIPESNNWIYSGGRNEAETSEYTWVQSHGYMLWNKAASAGAHIKGRKITSSEAMTNTAGVFRASLETIKQSDDMNFITGINQSVLHGFNYSPPEAGFPGWMRYGAYFSEQNTWWKYFKYWTDYNARLSSVFQNSEPVADIAVLGRLRDYWGEVGIARQLVNTTPWYYSRLWEPIGNLGSSCDYIHQPVLETAEIDGNELVCGHMRYRLVCLTEVESLTPGAAKKLAEFAKAGGKVVLIGTTPHRSLSFKNAKENDQVVKTAMEEMAGTGNAFQLKAPEETEDFIAWTRVMMEKAGIEPDVKISDPVSHLYAMKKTAGEQEIYFFVNSDRKKYVEFEAESGTGNKTPYLWDPATGERFRLSYKQKNKLHIRLGALESALIVYEPGKRDLPLYEFPEIPGKIQPLNTTWNVHFTHVNGTDFTRTMDKLIDLGAAEDEALNTFAGTVTYSAEIENKGNIHYIRLTGVNEGVTELFVNGKPAGTKWYGNHTYDVHALLQPGKNRIEIKLTTTLANYCRSLKENPAAQAWAGRYKDPFSSGLTGVEIGE